MQNESMGTFALFILEKLTKILILLFLNSLMKISRELKIERRR